MSTKAELAETRDDLAEANERLDCVYREQDRLEALNVELLAALKDALQVIFGGLISQQRATGEPTLRAERERYRIEAVLTDTITKAEEKKT